MTLDFCHLGLEELRLYFLEQFLLNLPCPAGSLGKETQVYPELGPGVSALRCLTYPAWGLAWVTGQVGGRRGMGPLLRGLPTLEPFPSPSSHNSV